MITLHEAPVTVAIEPEAGGRIAGIDVDGHPLLASRFGSTRGDPLRWGCYPMVPWAGRLDRGLLRFQGQFHQLPLTLPPHAIHGTGLWQPWTVEMQSPTVAMLRTELGPPWPFGGHSLHTISLAHDHLHLVLEVHAADQPMPAAVGWHPWFSRQIGRHGPAELRFDAGAMWERGDDQIPTGRLVPPTHGPWDDCFTDVAGPPRIRWPGALDLTVESNCPHVVVYDQEPDALCVEPQTLPPNGLNQTPPVLAPGEALLASCTMRWTVAR